MMFVWGRPCTNFFAGIEPVPLRHGDVQQDEVWRMLARETHRLDAVRRLAHDLAIGNSSR